MCPTPARRVTLLTCICRKSAAAFAFTGLSDGCGAFLSIPASALISASMRHRITGILDTLSPQLETFFNSSCVNVVIRSRVPRRAAASPIGRAEAEPTNTGAIVNQLDPFLPPCPITFRNDVIPPGYNGRLRADSSHRIVVGQAAAQMPELVERRGLPKRRAFYKAPENP